MDGLLLRYRAQQIVDLISCETRGKILESVHLIGEDYIGVSVEQGTQRAAATPSIADQQEIGLHILEQRGSVARLAVGEPIAPCKVEPSE